MASVYLHPVVRKPANNRPRLCDCDKPVYAKGRFRVAHYTCSKCLHIGMWPKAYDTLVCDKLLLAERVRAPHIFDCNVPDWAAYEEAVANVNREPISHETAHSGPVIEEPWEDCDGSH